MKKNNDRIAIYPGTFDPITNGHLDIIERASKLFDKLIISVATNMNKKPMFSTVERVKMIKESVKNIKNVSVDTFSGLLINYCNNKNSFILIRGLRAISDFENEFQMALMNRKIDNNIETVFLMPSEEYTYLSSSLIKEIASLNGDISKFVSNYVNQKMKEKI
ncbi:MAG: pantetheine-phosphate adenylyltransferase [Candidatus Marinimicrobia bacterium]|nr:pantetheine-phosphate adenylyltransferase [Candidatus Neomarinimicrobiota bacterium]